VLPEPGPSLSGTELPAGPLGTGAPGSGGAASGGGPSAGDFGEGGLPRRVRQASLAAQLRDATAEVAPVQPAEDFWTRSPEETRSTVTAIQQGWERGRSVFDVPAAAPAGSAAPDNGTGNGADAEAGNGAAVEAGNGATAAPAPDAGTAGAAGPEQATEDRGTSG
jgi:hypothetical protein